MFILRSGSCWGSYIWAEDLLVWDHLLLTVKQVHHVIVVVLHRENLFPQLRTGTSNCDVFRDLFKARISEFDIVNVVYLLISWNVQTNPPNLGKTSPTVITNLM